MLSSVIVVSSVLRLLRNLQFTENRDGLQPPLGFTPLGGTLSLEKFAELKEKGIISEEEFNKKKEQLLK